jgi:arginine deiminase
VRVSETMHIDLNKQALPRIILASPRQTTYITYIKDSSMDTNKRYGIEKFGRLKWAMLHRPTEAIRLVNEDNRELFLFDKVPDVDKYLEEHQKYGELLSSLGVDVMLLADNVTKNTDLMNHLPNLAYLHDIAVVTSRGAILSCMSSMGRRHEEIVVREALTNAGVPMLYEAPEGDAFEGCLLLSPTTVFVADTERHGRKAIERFIEFILHYFNEVVYAQIPQERRFMHPDMVLNRMSEHLCVYYPPAFQKTFYISRSVRKEIDVKAFMNEKGFEMVPLTDREQQQWGSSFVPLEPETIINYDISLDEKTKALLEREGIKFIQFHPDALLAGGGSLRCITMRVWRE